MVVSVGGYLADDWQTCVEGAWLVYELVVGDGRECLTEERGHVAQPSSEINISIQ